MNIHIRKEQVILKINAIALELNHIELTLRSTNQRISAINEGYEQSGKNPTYFVRNQVELETATNDKLGFEYKRDRLIVELSEIKDIVNE